MRRRRALLASACVAVLLCVAPTRAAAQLRLTSPGGHVFAFDASGALESSGRIVVYDPGFQLQVNDAPYAPAGPVTMSGDGRTATYAATTIGALGVQRLVYVPATGTHDFARFLDVLSNPGVAPASATVTLATTLDSFGYGSMVTGSSSGDTVVTTADDWFAIQPGSLIDVSTPLVAAVLQGPSAAARTRTEVGGRSLGPGGVDGASWTFDVTVPAGGRVAVLTFAVEKATTDMSGVTSDATYLVSTPDEVLVGLDTFLGAIVNFQEDAPGAPHIRFTGPETASEGDAVAITVAVTDPMHGAPSWTWDLDGDGTFGDLAGATGHTIPAGTTDGPSYVRLGVEATTATATSRRYDVIRIDDVAPTITSPPPSSTTTIGADYGAMIVATDPAGAADPLQYVCAHCPATMTVTDRGFVSWTPTAIDVTPAGSPLHVTITIDDGDMGTAVVAWDLTVLADHAPTRPTAIYPSGIAIADPTPRLVAGNATDGDDDPLTYVFELDVVSTFDSPAALTSPAVPQTDGFTAWRLPTRLVMGTPYFWRVKANDGVVDGAWATSTFLTAGAPPVRDAGAPTDAGALDAGHGVPPPRGGCSTNDETPTSGIVAIALVAVAVRKRRLAISPCSSRPRASAPRARPCCPRDP